MPLPAGDSVRSWMSLEVIVSSHLQDVTCYRFRPTFSLPCLAKMSIVTQVKSDDSWRSVRHLGEGGQDHGDEG
jgi:hypothetical protein